MLKSSAGRFFAVMLTAGAVALGASAAQAQSYPRVTGTGDNIMIDYGPMGQAALVGGGRVMVTQNSNMNIEVIHLDAMFVQEPRPGFVPLTIGDTASQMVIYVPAMMLEQLRRARTANR
jgi:hypothetical protein